ncbi:hypothetical protein E4T43_09294 [Aureobasidium subglaciale]|nr:hypothetical protein E4T43_09294 [Aureobasidium subglaciale]
MVGVRLTSHTPPSQTSSTAPIAPHNFGTGLAHTAQSILALSLPVALRSLVPLLSRLMQPVLPPPGAGGAAPRKIQRPGPWPQTRLFGMAGYAGGLCHRRPGSHLLRPFWSSHFGRQRRSRRPRPHAPPAHRWYHLCNGNSISWNALSTTPGVQWPGRSAGATRDQITHTHGSRLTLWSWPTGDPTNQMIALDLISVMLRFANCHEALI